MMSETRRRLILFLAGTGLTLILMGLVPLMAAAQDTTTPEATAEASEAQATELPPLLVAPTRAPIVTEDLPHTGNNSYCAVCHSLAWRTLLLPDGVALNLFVSPETVMNSVHGRSNPEGALGCVDCHGEDIFPHSGPSPETYRDFALEAVKNCETCHTDKAQELATGLHAEAIAAGDKAAAVCTDCHGSHNVQPVEQDSQLIAGVCGDCHVSTLAEWRSSAHVAVDPLGCATCHSPHSQRIRVEGGPEALCQNCHREMPSLWVHDQHRNELEQPIGCNDCHMYVEPSSEGQTVGFADPRTMNTGHTMEVTTLPCNTCHSQLVSDSTGSAPDVVVPETAIPEPTGTEHGEAESMPQSSYIQLIQGLILGLGLGATAAVIFVTRGNRQK